MRDHVTPDPDPGPKSAIRRPRRVPAFLFLCSVALTPAICVFGFTHNHQPSIIALELDSPQRSHEDREALKAIEVIDAMQCA
jgi:hypothetical protein